MSSNTCRFFVRHPTLRKLNFLEYFLISIDLDIFDLSMFQLRHASKNTSFISNNKILKIMTLNILPWTIINIERFSEDVPMLDRSWLPEKCIEYGFNKSSYEHTLYILQIWWLLLQKMLHGLGLPHCAWGVGFEPTGRHSAITGCKVWSSTR